MNLKKLSDAFKEEEATRRRKLEELAAALDELFKDVDLYTASEAAALALTKIGVKQHHRVATITFHLSHQTVTS